MREVEAWKHAPSHLLTFPVDQAEVLIASLGEEISWVGCDQEVEVLSPVVDNRRRIPLYHSCTGRLI